MSRLAYVSVLLCLTVGSQADCNGDNCWPHWKFDCDSDSDCSGNAAMMSIGAVKCGNANCPYKSATLGGWGPETTDDCCVKQALWKKDDKIALYEGWDCDYDSDCDHQRFRDAMQTSRLYCGNANADWYSWGTRDDVCVAAIADGEEALTAIEKGDVCVDTLPWCYSSCASNHGICGYCGLKNGNGKPCDTNDECESGACEMACFAGVATTAACSGTCRPKQPDGAPLSKLGCYDFSDLGKNGIAIADYDLCESGVGVCGTCGRIVPKESRCTRHTECAGYSESNPLVCCGHYDGLLDTAHCGGICMDATPTACRSAFDVAADTAAEAAKVALEELKEFAECMKEEVGERVGLSDDEAEEGCQGSMSGTSVEMKCQAPPVNLSLGTAEQPRELSHCSQSKSGTCSGGLMLQVFAEASLTPEVTAALDLGAMSMSVELAVGFEANVGIAASVSSACSRSEDLLYPEVPLQTKPICAQMICIVLLYQTKFTVMMDGSATAGAKAQYGMAYDVSGGLSINLDPRKFGQNGPHLDLGELSKAWRFQASSGTLTGSVSVAAGPLLTIIVLPGIVVSFHPYARVQASFCGTGIGIDEQHGDQSLLKEMAGPATCGVDDVAFHATEPCLNANLVMKTGFDVHMGLPGGVRLQSAIDSLKQACGEMIGAGPVPVGVSVAVSAAECVGKALANDPEFSVTAEVCGTIMKVFDDLDVASDFPLVEEVGPCVDLWTLSGSDTCSSEACPGMGCSAATTLTVAGKDDEPVDHADGLSPAMLTLAAAAMAAARA